MKKILLLTALIGFMQTDAKAQNINHWIINNCTCEPLSITIYCDDPEVPCGRAWSYSFTVIANSCFTGLGITSGDYCNMTTWVGGGTPPSTTPCSAGGVGFNWSDITIHANNALTNASFPTSPIGCGNTSGTLDLNLTCGATATVDWTLNSTCTDCVTVDLY